MNVWSNTNKIMMRFIAKLIVLLFCTTFLAPLVADDGNYKVGPGDVLQITVTGEPDFSGQFTVRSDKSIFYSYVKAVDVDGLTVREIADKLTGILGKDYIKSPTVNVMIKDYASKSVKVLGAVNKPGVYMLRGDTRLLDIITMAGGKSEQAGSTVTIVRAAKSVAGEATPTASDTIVINYSDIVEKGKMELNVLLEPDDVINIPKGNEIFVLGQVNHPGPVLFKDNLTILQAISVAGGPGPAASTKSTYIIRKDDKGGSKKLSIRLDRIMEQKEENIPLFANDVIVVPESFF